MNRMIIQLGKVTAIVGGVHLLFLAIFQAVVDANIEDYPILAQTVTLMPIMLLLAASGLFVLANEQRGVQIGVLIIMLGAVLMIIGFAMMTWFINENGWTPMFIGFLIMPLGLLVLGAANWRARILSRWNRVPLIGSVAATILVFVSVLDLFAAQDSEYLFASYLLLLAINWVMIGMGMTSAELPAGKSPTEAFKPTT